MTKTITASILQKKTFRKTKLASLKCTSQKWLFCNSRVARKQKNLQPSQAQEQSIFAKFRWLNLQKCHFSMPILQFSLTLKLQNLWNVRLRSLFQSLYLRSLALACKSGIFLGEFFGRLTLFFFRFFLEDGRRYTYCHGNKAIFMVFEKICIFKPTHSQICVLETSMLSWLFLQAPYGIHQA